MILLKQSNKIFKLKLFDHFVDPDDSILNMQILFCIDTVSHRIIGKGSMSITQLYIGSTQINDKKNN